MRHWMILCLGLAACSSSSGGADATDMVDCSTITGTDTFTVGLHHVGTAGLVDFTMMSATPAPPARDDNTWIIQLNAMASGADANVIDSATMTATPFMPSHQHGTPKQVIITPVNGTPGQYTLAPVNMWMPGVWETTIKVTAPQTDSAVFRFCIPS